MARHTRKEFAELCGIKTGDLSNYIKRGKVVADNDLIDDRNEINKLFIEKRKLKKKPVAEKPVDTAVDEPKHDEPRSTGSGYTETMRQKAELDILHKHELIESKRLENRKKLGQVVPTEDVKRLFVMHSENIKGAYMEASDNLIVIFSNKGGLNATDISEMRKKFVDLVNGAVDKAIMASKNDIKALVAEFSEKRGVGQHD